MESILQPRELRVVQQPLGSLRTTWLLPPRAANAVTPEQRIAVMLYEMRLVVVE